MNQYIKASQQKLDDIVAHFEDEVAGIRTGRATPALVEHVVVEAYGVRTPLKQLATVTVPEPRQLLIQPWDKMVGKDIEKAIAEMGFGVGIANEGGAVRL